MIHEPERKHPSHTREHILDSAAHLVMEGGFQGMTLDAVAKAAGISKGGLLYHFPSKEALVGGLIDARHEWMKNAVLTEKASLSNPDAPGAWHRAIVRAAFKTFLTCNEITSSMLGMVAQDQGLVERIRQGIEEISQIRANDGVPRDISNLVMGCLDGMKMHRIVCLPLPLQEESESLQALLLKLIDDSVVTTSGSFNPRESA